MRGASVLFAIALLAATGCGSSDATPERTRPRPATPASSTAPSLDPPDPAAEEARAFRVRFGLRADLEWIRAVAANPVAERGIEEYGVPLMPLEIADLHGRHNPLEQTDLELLGEIRGYGALFPGSFAGAYIDQRIALGFIVLFTGDTARHDTTLENLLPELASIEVRQVEWSLRQLDAFRQLVQADLGWTADLPLVMLGTGHRVTENFVYLQYLGAEGLGPLIAAHYGNPSWLVVERMGPLPWNGARADLIIDISERDGSPAVGIKCDGVSLEPEIQIPESNLGSGPDGRCTLGAFPVGTYQVALSRFVDDDRYVLVKTLQVELVTPRVVIAVTLDAQ